MELGEKLQQLRKQRGLTQEELAAALYVSRTAVSKWESGKGYPNIDSLKAIARFFSVTVDELLSGDEWLTVAQADSKQRQASLRACCFGLFDLAVGALLFLPFFGQKSVDTIHAVTLLSLTEISPFLRTVYLAFVALSIAVGVLLLAAQTAVPTWSRRINAASLSLSAVGVVLFAAGQQPYAAVFVFLFLAIKGATLIRRT